MKSGSIYLVLLTTLIGVFSIVSCKKDMQKEAQENVVPVEHFSIPAASPVTGSVSGLVVDENNSPVDGAEIKLGTLSTLTDTHGQFNFNNAALDKYITTVTVAKSGYFKGYRSFSANPGRNYVGIKLIPKTLSGTLSSVSGGMLTLSNGTELSFRPSSLVLKSDGSIYTGSTHVYAAYIDPTSSDISAVVPGSFMGTDGSNLYNLQSTGMIAVDLETDGGEPLQLAAGLSATIRLPIPASLQAKAPAEINTWSLTEQGIWKKEGTAVKSGNFYEVEATHFSFWNCDVPANAIYLTLHVQDQNGNALVNTFVELTIPNSTTWWASTSGYTDNLGNVSGLVPSYQNLEMDIFSDPYSCGTPVNTQNIGPFSGNTSLTVTATLTGGQTLTVTGSATDCNSQPLQDGIAIIYAGQYNYQYASIVNGAYSASLTQCTPIPAVNVIVIDNSNGNQDTSGNISVTGSQVIIPAVSACGTSQLSVFTFTNSQGTCETGNFIGTYTAGIPVTNNSITMMVNVLALGTYLVSTAPVNGISFSGSGTFTNTGAQSVVLTATGTPASAGTYSFIAESNGVLGCSFIIPFGGTTGSQAVIDLGGTGSCSNIFVNGSYITGIPMNSANTATITVNVTTPGSYYIFTNNTNGIIFSDSGTVTQAGIFTLVLSASGTPLSNSFNTYQLQSSAGVTGCIFGVTTQASTNSAIYSFDGTPFACSSAVIGGTYTSGTPLDASNFVTLSVDVTSVGTYNITTDFESGMSFSAQGIFSTTGPQTVTLSGTGTPEVGTSGNTSYIPMDGAISGCIFTIPVD